MKTSVTTRPARNRVTPFGDIIAVPGRGAWMGNRGRLHEGADSRDIVRNHQNKTWITCALSYKDRRLTQWQPGHYTQLFFLDEAVAFAAGHRPCAECRRPAYNSYRSAWSAASPGHVIRAKDMDDVLHQERRFVGRTDRPRHDVSWIDLPDGTFVNLEQGPAVVVDDHLALWEASDNTYRQHLSRPRDGIASVITPASNVAVLNAGYPVRIDESAR
jgi:hypothetical protein